MFPTLRLTSRTIFSLRSPTRVCAVPRVRNVVPFARTIVTKRYTEDHEVILYDDVTSQGTLSITSYASKSLGDVVFVELPKEGTQVAKGEQIGAVESVKAASDIVEFHFAPSMHGIEGAQYAPVSGTVEEINSVLGERPGLMGSSPETDGWLCKLKLSNPTELDSLLSEEAYEKYCEGLDD